MPNMRELVADLEARRAKVREMGGVERVEKQHSRGKMTARERVAAFFDDGVFFEIGMHGTQMGMAAGPDGSDKPAADGVVTTFGKVDGRMVCCAAYDFTVKGGSIGYTGEEKVTRLRSMALKGRWPMVWLIDSGGARIDPGSSHPDMISLFAGTGHLFREQVAMSGVVPQVAAMVGPGAAGTAYIPGLADFVPMVKGTSSIAIGGPYLVESVVGEKVTEEELGGSKVHAEISGVADAEYPDDSSCLAGIRTYLSFFPSHCEEKPPRRAAVDPVEGADQRLLAIVPDNPRQAFDMHKVILCLVDGGEFFPIKDRFARNIITGLARIDGYSIGILANNSMFYGGVLDVNASDKAARFINLCDAFNIPLLFLQDVPGFMVGTKVEQQGIIRHGAKMLYAVASATVPKFTVIVRKGYGAGYYVMNGRAYEPDLIVAWPGSEIGIMGPEGIVAIGARKLLRDAPSPELAKSTREELGAQLRKHISIYRTAALAMIDDVIDPRQTRRSICRALRRTANKKVERPHRRREISPV